jgi:hypothetical protein
MNANGRAKIVCSNFIICSVVFNLCHINS